MTILAQSTNDAVLARIHEIDHHLNYIANRYAPGTGQDPEDLRQSFVLTFLERQACDPSFIEQKNAFQLIAAKWQALHSVTKEDTYRRHVDILEEDQLELIPGEGNNPEDLIIESESAEEILAIVEHLTSENQTVIRMIYLGYNESEIAQMLGISRPAVSQRKQTIRKAFMRHGITGRE